jgi:excisionase family DNA binding protein
MDPNINTLLSVKQVAYILKVHPLTVRRYIKEERLKAVKSGGNVRIRESDLSEFNKDFKPNTPRFPKTEKQPTFQIFNESDPLFQLKGKGASLDL